MQQVEQVDDPSGLAPYRQVWRELLACTPHASYFQSFEWLETRWKHSDPRENLRVVITRDGDVVTGIVPLCVKHERTSCGVVRTLTFPIDGWGSFFGPLGPQPEETLRDAIAHTWRGPRDFDVIELRSLSATDAAGQWYSVDEETTPVVANIAGNETEEFSRVGILDLDQDWDAYWASRNKQKNRRRNVERCERRLSELGEIRYERYRPAGDAPGSADPRWDLYDACEQLARTSWQDGLVDGNTLHHEHVRPFLRDAHIAAVRAGAVDVNLLFLGDRPLAFVYGYHYRGYVDLMRIGFDREFAKLAPGNALWTRLIQDSFQRGDRVLDFGPTCLDYKRFWITRLEPSFRVLQYSRSPRAQALRLARWLKGQRRRAADESNRQNKELAAENVAVACEV
jgi:CelD/BcsL family acetyltransferase involved in cellulose biosynthesis